MTAVRFTAGKVRCVEAELGSVRPEVESPQAKADDPLEDSEQRREEVCRLNESVRENRVPTSNIRLIIHNDNFEKKIVDIGTVPQPTTVKINKREKKNY